MEEENKEKNKVENANNEKSVDKEKENQDNKDKSSSKLSHDSISKALKEREEGNKYKSRRNLFNTATNNSDRPSTRRKTTMAGGIKNHIANRALSSVANAHPALKALNTLNNVRKTIMARSNATSPTSNNTFNDAENKQDETNSINSNGENTSDDNVSIENKESNSSNPLHSILGSTGDILGKFSFFGKIPKGLKIGIMLAGPLITICFFILIPFTVIGFFSGFWEIDIAEASSGGTGTIDYGDYSLSSDGHEILHESLDTFLASNGTNLEEFNNLIATNVEEAGSGTRAGVVAAAVTLIAELGNNYGVKIPYFWGGGHSTISIGAEGSWGSGRCYTYANGQAYTYCGLDCSGFVTWALNNGGFDVPPQSSGTFQNLSGARRVSLGSSAILQAGDLLATSGHIILIVGVDDSGYICAEAAGNETGVLFSRKDFSASGYWGIDMSGFYGE